MNLDDFRLDIEPNCGRWTPKRPVAGQKSQAFKVLSPRQKQIRREFADAEI
jgi:hypothetical protein